MPRFLLKRIVPPTKEELERRKLAEEERMRQIWRKRFDLNAPERW